MGIIANAHFAQMADFALGWVGIDFAGDDGRKFGLWPWQSDPAGARETPQRLPDPPRAKDPPQAKEAPPRPARPPAPSGPKRPALHDDQRLQGLP